MTSKPINQQNNWLGKKVESFSDDELRAMFVEIAEFRRTGLLLSPSKLRSLERDFSNFIQNHDGHLRLVEDEVLFEMSRRFFNQAV